MTIKGLKKSIEIAGLTADEGILTEAFNKLEGDEFERIGKDFFDKDKNSAALRDLEPLAKACGVHYYTAQLALVLADAAELEKVYVSKGYDEKFYVNLLNDVKVKREECFKRFGVIGTNDGSWYCGFFSLRRFAFDRLTFDEARRLQFGYDKFGADYKPGDEVVAVHISSGRPLLREDVIASLKEAYEFFNYKLVNGLLVVFCISWLIYEPYVKEIYSPESNLAKFAKLFDPIGEVMLPEYFHDAWRIFYKEDLSDPDSLPQDTSLQRKFVKWIKEGKPNGEGAGVLVFDGEKVLTERP